MDLEPMEASPLSLKAVRAVQVLIDMQNPETTEEIPGWLRKVRLLQGLLSSYWELDTTGRLMEHCLSLLYAVLALNVAPLGAAAWGILELVQENKIYEFVDAVLTNPDTNDNLKVQNVFSAVIDSIGKYGPFTPRLEKWVAALINGLEFRQNYTLLIEIAENSIWKVFLLMFLPAYRPLIFPFFKQFLFSVTTSRVFYRIVGKLPRLLDELENDLSSSVHKNLCIECAALIRAQVKRFPAQPGFERKYALINACLRRFPEIPFDSGPMIYWDPKESSDPSKWSYPNTVAEIRFFPTSAPFKGLINQGNTCFMNSVLQVLFMNTRFRLELFDKEFHPSERAATQLRELFAFLQQTERPALLPRILTESTFPSTFRVGRQQDASEYFMHLLNILHESELRILQQTPAASSLPSAELESRILERDRGAQAYTICPTCSKPQEETETLVDRLFGGIMLSTITCYTCNNIVSKTEKFKNLDLPIPDNFSMYNLQELFELSLQAEELTGENLYHCLKCDKKTRALMKYRIIKAPQHLILTFKLYRCNLLQSLKLKLQNKLLNFRSVNVTVYNADDTERELLTYSLKASILHSGSTVDSGHYMASAVDINGEWYLFNDALVASTGSEWYSGGGNPYVVIMRRSDISDPPSILLPVTLQLMVNRDNQQFIADQGYKEGQKGKKKG